MDHRAGRRPGCPGDHRPAAVAAGLLVGALIDRIKRAAIAVDPGWAERRYRAAIQGRRVQGSRNDDGTANLHGLDLPVDRAAAACDRIDTLARACKRAGDGRPIDHIRADLYLGMLDGTFEVLTEDQVIDHVLQHPFTDPVDPDAAKSDHGADGDDDGARPTGDGGGGQGDGGGGQDGDGGDSGDRHGAGAGGADARGGPGDGPGGGDSGDRHGAGVGGTDARGGRAGADGSGREHRSGRGRDGGDTDRPSSVAASGPGATHGAATRGTADRAATLGAEGPAGGGTSPGGWCVRELRVELAALVGLNEHPAEIVGWDFIPVSLARPVLASMHGTQWRWVVCDRDGRPIDSGITRRRPAPPSDSGPPGPTPAGPPLPVPRPPGRRRSAIVEFQVRAGELPELMAAGRQHGWAAVLADISAQHASGGADDTATDDPFRRRARTRPRRVVQIRDRYCTHPACRAPASRTDQDHAVDHADGGPTDEANLGSCCRHDHRLKHDGGWQIAKPAALATVWTSPLGHRYSNLPPPVMPAPPAQCPCAAGPGAAVGTRDVLGAAAIPIVREVSRWHTPHAPDPPPF